MNTRRSLAPFYRYGVAIAAVGMALAFRLSLASILGNSYPILIFFPAIMFAGWWGGTAPGILSVVLSIGGALYFLLPPIGAFSLHRPADVVGMLLFAVIGLLITFLNEKRMVATLRAEEAAGTLRENQAELQIAYEHQKRIAETLQRSLLMTPAEMQFDGLEVEAFYEPARDEALVGGDFFDAFALAGNKVALVVGDVSGKGLQAATHTAEIKFALRAILREHPHPASALVRLNNVVCESQELDTRDFGRFVTLSLAVVDPRTGEAELSLAGAEPPLLVRARAAAEALVTEESASPFTFDALEGGGLPLCVESKFSYDVRRFEMGIEDTLMLLTDGITEARKGRDLLGYDRMADMALSGAAKPTLRELGDTVMDGARAFAGGKLQDDACLLLARRI
jgi:serine phosphatase RsbU (regulator of sigma subunit)